MAELKGIEKFVAESLQTFYFKSSKEVSFDEGDDPPDIILNIDNKKISVEITELDQNVLKNRRTISNGYLNFINNLDKELKNLIDNDQKILIIFYHNYTKVSKINRKFKKYLKKLIEQRKLEINSKIDDSIGNVNFQIKILKMPKEGRLKIAGATMPYSGKITKSRSMTTTISQISDSDLSLQTNRIIINRIQDKTIKCKDIEKPIWLALYDSYYKKFTNFDSKEHIEHYQDNFKDIKDFGIFEKILVIFDNGDVLEFNT